MWLLWPAKSWGLVRMNYAKVSFRWLGFFAYGHSVSTLLCARLMIFLTSSRLQFVAGVDLLAFRNLDLSASVTVFGLGDLRSPEAKKALDGFGFART